MDSAGERCSSEILTCMVLAVEQAKCALDCLEVSIGCVIIEDGKVIASGRNQTTETRDLRSLTGSSSPEQTVKP